MIGNIGNDKGLLIKLAVHHIIMVIMAAIAMFAIWYIYMMVKTEYTEVTPTPTFQNKKGAAKPLPDFLIDTMKPDELGQLKP